MDDGSPQKPLPDTLSETLSDVAGHFSLAARYKLGVVLLYGDPMDSPVAIRLSRAGYRDLGLRLSYNFYVHPHETIRADAVLVPVGRPALRRP